MSPAKSLLSWFDKTARDLPWRHHRTLYSTVVSEFMLQQTRVSTALPYFEKWMSRFPDFASVAKATETEVLAHWQGLGYYNRARRLQQVCKALGTTPPQATVEFWLSLPGIGDYTARAILSMHYGLPLLAWDGNLLRVFSRLGATNDIATDGITRRWMKPLTLRERKVLNEALMDLGATICTPKNPQCPQCPLRGHCKAFQQRRTGEFPVRKVVPNNSLEMHRGLYATGTHIALLQNQNKSSSLFGFWELPLCEPKGTQLAVIKRSIGKHSIREHVYKLLTPPRGTKLLPIVNLGDMPVSGPHKKYISTIK